MICRNVSRADIAAGLVAACALLGSQTAAAEPTDIPRAQALFDEGRMLMESGRYSDACPKLAESHKLDPGGGTLLNMGVCYEKAGKTASAWAVFNEAANVARTDGRPDREKFAREHAAALEPMLSRLTIRIPSGVDTSGLTIKVDGSAVARADWGKPVPLDPGGHRVDVSAPGKQAWSKQVSLGSQNDDQAVEIPVLADRIASESQEGNQSTIGYVVAGAGLVALGVGSYFGLKSFSKWSDRNDNCTNGCNQAAVQAAADTKSNADISTVAFGVGVVGIGVGTYLILSSPSDSAERGNEEALRVEPILGPGAAGLGVGGVW